MSEKRFSRHSKSGGKGWKSRSKSGGYRGFHGGFHAEMIDDESWEWASQTPTGFSAVDDGEWDYVDDELYTGGAGYVSEYDMTEETDDEAFLVMNFALLSESGFDMNNEEACALAAESLQLENEAYMLRTQGKGKGHGGFQQQRQFDISGQVSFQERKARLAQLKAKTECRRCGMKGHWSGDAACPKGPRKGSNSPKKDLHNPLQAAKVDPRQVIRQQAACCVLLNDQHRSRTKRRLWTHGFWSPQVLAFLHRVHWMLQVLLLRVLPEQAVRRALCHLLRHLFPCWAPISIEEMRQAQRMREAAKDKVKNVRGGIPTQDLQDLQQAHDTLSGLLSASSGFCGWECNDRFGSYGSGWRRTITRSIRRPCTHSLRCSGQGDSEPFCTIWIAGSSGLLGQFLGECGDGTSKLEAGIWWALVGVSSRTSYVLWIWSSQDSTISRTCHTRRAAVPQDGNMLALQDQTTTITPPSSSIPIHNAAPIQLQRSTYPTTSFWTTATFFSTTC